MDPFDERILTVLGDGRPRGFRQLLGEVGFSHNTLRLHLERLVDKGLVMKQKMPTKGLGRPRFSYSLLLDTLTPINLTKPGKGFVDRNKPETNYSTLHATESPYKCLMKNLGFVNFFMVTLMRAARCATSIALAA